MKAPFPEMRSRFGGLAEGSESGVWCGNFEAPAGQPERHQGTTGHRSLGFRREIRMEIGIWEMSLKMSYEGGEVCGWKPRALHV